MKGTVHKNSAEQLFFCQLQNHKGREGINTLKALINPPGLQCHFILL